MAEYDGFVQGHLEIGHLLQDVVCDEFENVIFECKMSDRSDRSSSCRWYKDGKLVDARNKVKITCTAKSHRLEIPSVKHDDQGVYLHLMKNFLGQVFTKANLYVLDSQFLCQKLTPNVIYMTPSVQSFGVVKHLNFIKILAGGTIELEATFNADALNDYEWYKSNNKLRPNERIILLNDKRTASLSILRAEEADSGLYMVVSKSEYGIASSFATVVVIKTDIATLNANEIVSIIDDPLPDELEVNEGEDIRLICKASYDLNTAITWSKNGKIIEENSNITTEHYNNKYICLKIKKSSINDTGKYKITLTDKITELPESSSCFVTVKEIPKELQPWEVRVKKPLESTVTCFGARMSCMCSFGIADPKFYFVVWHVGHYRIERTNHKFNVMQSGGDFFLVVKKIEPDMAGEITCELRKSLTNKKSILVNRTVATLTIVPSSILKRELNILSTKDILYFNGNKRTWNPLKYRKGQNGTQDDSTVSSENDDKDKDEFQSIMEITYCRLENHNSYLSVHTDDDEIRDYHFAANLMWVHPESPSTTISRSVPSAMAEIEWRNAQMQEPMNTLYIIELEHETYGYIEVGMSSVPLIQIKEPVQEQIMKFRVIATDAVSKSKEVRICKVPATRPLKKSKKNYEVRTLDEFETIYTKTGATIGCGAFGSVVLVRDNAGEYYAAKILKTRTQKKRDGAIREYEVLKKLKHPKIVELHQTFLARDSCILVMDYLWGGELFDRIVEEDNIKEVDVVIYVRQICEALSYLHERKIAHLDLKPENIVCLSPNSRKVKIIDFGLARVLEEGHVTRVIYGTRDYVAPEVLNYEELTLACDMWSLGVVTYMLLSGVMPFGNGTWLERSANITKAKYDYHESAFKEISDTAKGFVNNLLQLKVDKRMKASDALGHRWIVEGPPPGEKTGRMKRTQENLKSYLANNRARWQRAGNVMIAAHRLRTYLESPENKIPTIPELPRGPDNI